MEQPEPEILEERIESLEHLIGEIVDILAPVLTKLAQEKRIDNPTRDALHRAAYRLRDASGRF